ncbi:unnamed protein product [Heligmosomoides polygyrus]|uniref:Alpha-1,2-Mannosidase n=1 Tax=Heligmosomoides polygyrus TaxID=6339 RepID=A0A3P7ZXA9_HELPZ|nr:unnamed protein product [Heligmosomoides polygyrus]
MSLVDALDTLIIMGNTTEFRRAVDLVLKSVKTDANVNVSVFETNIRIVGGLVSAHMLSGRVEGMQLEDGWPCSGPLLRLAKAMAARLLPAFNTGMVQFRSFVEIHTFASKRILSVSLMEPYLEMFDN